VPCFDEFFHVRALYFATRSGYVRRIAIAIYPPPGPREDKRTASDYVLGGLLLLAIAALVAAVIWLIVSGRVVF
jgi:hypothetical protein